MDIVVIYVHARLFNFSEVDCTERERGERNIAEPPDDIGEFPCRCDDGYN